MLLLAPCQHHLAGIAPCTVAAEATPTRSRASRVPIAGRMTVSEHQRASRPASLASSSCALSVDKDMFRPGRIHCVVRPDNDFRHMVTRESSPTRLPAIAGSADTVELEVSLFVTPSAVLLITATTPNLDPFARIDPLKDDLWIRLEAGGRHAEVHPRMEFATRRKSDATKAALSPIAGSSVVSSYGTRAFTLLATQMVADLLIAQNPPGDDACSELLHLEAILEPTSYDWNRYQALCARFKAARTSSAGLRRSDAGGALPGRRS